MITANVILDYYKWKNKIKNPKNYLKKKIQKLSKIPNFKGKKQEFSILLTSNKKMKTLNYKFRKKNKPTDVLSFPFQEKKVLKSLLRKNKTLYLGDVIISLDKIYPKFKKEKLKENFDRLWIHGLLHLLGERHRVNKDYIKMKKLEERFYNYIN